ncbi:MAG: CoA-disulfide reductase [Culicoidibacterales bacterium]
MKVIIIGGIAAGATAAAKLNRVNPNAQITMYEKEAYVSFGACGLPYFVGDQFHRPEGMISRTPEQFAKTGITVKVQHEVIAIDPQQQSVQVRNLATGETYTDTYDQLLLATGATPIQPQVPGHELANIFTFTKLQDGEALKAKLADVETVTIVGAGFIGLELAEQLHELGKKVRIIELSNQIMGKVFDPEISEQLAAELVANGVDVHLNEAVTAFSGSEQVETVITEKGEYATDLVIIAIGFQPNVKLVQGLGFEQLGNGAIIVDNQGKTSVPNVYAVGDCATVLNKVLNEPMYLPLATTANKLGRIVGEVIGGLDSYFPGMLASSGIRCLGIEAGATGLNEQLAKAKGLDYRTTVIKDKDHTSYVRGAVELTVKLVYDAQTKVILGGQIIGPKNAVLRVDVLAAAIYKEMTTDELGLLDLVYSPPFARTWDILNVAGNVSR